jgi:hypothetical protein
LVYRRYHRFIPNLRSKRGSGAGGRGAVSRPGVTRWSLETPKGLRVSP